MNRRGISILGVLSLTVGALVAEYAFAPLRDAYYPITVKPPTQSDAESTASPRKPDPVVPANQTQHSPVPVEHRILTSEPEGDAMLASARPVIDAVWQTVSDDSVRAPVSVAATSALAGSEPATRWMAAPTGGFVSLGGGAFFGTQHARGSAPQSAAPPAVAASSVPASAPPAPPTSEPGPVVNDAAPVVPPQTSGPIMAMNDEPTPPATVVPMDAGAPLPAAPPSIEAVSGNEESTPSASVSTPPLMDPVPMLEDMAPPVTHVSVPEPLSGSLFLFGIAVGALSRRRRRPV